MGNGKEGDSGSFESLLGQEGNMDKMRHIQKLDNTKMFLNILQCIFCSEHHFPLN